MKDDTCITYIWSPYIAFDNCIIRTHTKDDTCLTYIHLTERSTPVSFERTKRMIHVLLTFTLHSVRQLYHSNAQKRWYMSYLHSVCRTFDNCIIWIYNMQVRRYMQAIGTTAMTLHTQNKAKVVHWDKLKTMTMKLPTHNRNNSQKTRFHKQHECDGFLSPILTRCIRYNITCKSDLRQVGGFLRLLRFPPPIKLTATI